MRSPVLLSLAALASCEPSPAPLSAPLPPASTAIVSASSAVDAGLEVPSKPRPTLDSAVAVAVRATAEAAIARGEVPGAVIAIVIGGEPVFLEAFGARRRDAADPMRPDTLFDLASLTKAVATAPSIHLLAREGKIALTAPVARYLPAFAANGKADVTVEDLLLHRSGLPADDALSDYRGGREAALAKIEALPLASPRGARFVYSDVGFIVLGAIVEAVTRTSLATFASDRLFAPLGMKDTGFTPDVARRGRAAPTEPRDGHLLEGEVHDPRAAGLDGVAGHAGLFSTAGDLARFAAMLLAKGRRDDQAILAPEAVARMIEPVTLPGGGVRSRGWDIRTSFSGARGELGGFGHTGFTGTSLWIDPELDAAVVVLTSRLQLGDRGDPRRLRREVATLVARAARAADHAVPGSTPTGHVATGIDVLEREGFARLAGRKVGLVTNASGLDAQGRSTLDLIHAANGVKLVAVFAPEHGLRASEDGPVGDGRDARTGLPIYSLYGKRTRPTDAELAGIDTLVFDIADAGARFFTFETTLGYLLEVAAARHLRVVVLDRPNPIGGVAVEGPVLDPSLTSFIGYHPIPVRHGMTMGELARLWNGERHLGADLDVVRMEGWRREDLFDATGVPWVSPSPSLRSLDEALAYPGVALLEATNVSVGRGTAHPFEQVGAPWMDGARVARGLASLSLPGVSFVETSFTPTSSLFANELCHGVAIHIDDRARFEPVRAGIALAHVLVKVHGGTGGAWKTRNLGLLLGHPASLAALLRGDDPAAIVDLWRADLEAFRARRRRYLLYGAEQGPDAGLP